MDLTYVYRLLNGNEDPRVGIIAKNPNATVKLVQHVAYGSWGQASHYISTCASYDAVKYFASKSTNPIHRIVKIDVQRLIRESVVDIIDLSTSASCQENFEKNVDEETYKRAENFAKAFSEVVIVGRIPPSCIETM